MKILTLIFALSIYLCNGQGPIVSYPLDNEQAIDYVNGLNGLIKGGAYSCDDRHGNKCAAIYFNGVDAYIEVPHSPVLNSISNSYSISFWFKIAQTVYADDRETLSTGNESINGNRKTDFRFL